MQYLNKFLNNRPMNHVKDALANEYNGLMQTPSCLIVICLLIPPMYNVTVNAFTNKTT